MSKISLIFALCATVVAVECRPEDSNLGADKSNLTPLQIFNNALMQTYPHIGDTSKDEDASLSIDKAIAYSLRNHIINSACGVADEKDLPHVQYEKYYTMAASTVRLCGRLIAMEKCLDILRRSSLEVAKVLRRGTITGVQVYEYGRIAIESKIENDPELSPIYKQIKANLPVIEYTDVTKVRGNKAKQRMVGTQGMKFLLYKMHVQHSYGNISTAFKKEYYVTARSVFELAKKPNKLEALQILYDEFISEIINLWDQKLLKVEVASDVPSTFYAQLDEKISSSPELKDDYETIKPMVETSSKWPTKSFNVGSYPFK